MSVVYNAAVKNARMIVVRDAIATGGGTATIEIGTAGMGSILTTVNLPATPSSVSADVLTFLGTPIPSTAGNSGAAAAARVKDKAGTVIVSGLTVGTSGTDVIISSTSITTGDTVTMNSGTITHG